MEPRQNEEQWHNLQGNHARMQTLLRQMVVMKGINQKEYLKKQIVKCMVESLEIIQKVCKECKENREVEK